MEVIFHPERVAGRQKAERSGVISEHPTPNTLPPTPNTLPSAFFLAPNLHCNFAHQWRWQSHQLRPSGRSRAHLSVARFEPLQNISIERGTLRSLPHARVKERPGVARHVLN